MLLHDRAARSLAVVGVAMLLLRVLYVLRIPDLNGDAYAHFHVGRALLDQPRDIPVHWVWLPGWHFVLAGLQRIGLSFRDVRLVHALVATLGPLLVYRHAPTEVLTEEPSTSNGNPTFNKIATNTKWLAAMLFTICSLANLAGTSALMEVIVTLLVLGGALAIDEASQMETASRGRMGAAVRAGILLTLACTIRYEAWIIVAALGLDGLFFTVRARARGNALSPLKTRAIVFAIPTACICVYILFRRSTDGEWLWFIRETYRFTHMQRDLSTHSTLFQLAWFPILLPFMLLGPAIVFVPIAALAMWRDRARTRMRPSTVVPISLIVFLFATYVGKGALGQARYLTVLMPFACIAIASGVSSLALTLRKRGKPHAWTIALVTGTILSVCAATTLMTFRTASSALEQEADLRAMERWATSPRQTIPNP